MSFLKNIKAKLKGRLANLVEGEVVNAMEELLPVFIQLKEMKDSKLQERQSYYDHTKDPYGNRNYYESLKDRAIAAGLPVVEIDIDINDFEKWLNAFFEIRSQYVKSNDVYIEKCLEHYLTSHYLNISKDDVVIDIAAAASIYAKALEKRGIRSYRLDLSYPEGVHGDRIGADAGNTNLPEEFASVLTAHCAYECFMGEADIKFVNEAARILKKNGRYGIVPLYLEDTYYVSVSPYCNLQHVVVEEEAKRVWRDDVYKVPFSRAYSPESFKERIYSRMPADMKGTIYYFRNLSEIMLHYKDQRIYCYFMFVGEK